MIFDLTLGELSIHRNTAILLTASIFNLTSSILPLKSCLFNHKSYFSEFLKRIY